jgi:hypothetical protein
MFNGRHVMIDAVLLDADKFEILNDISTGVDMINTIIEKIDMTILVPPIVVKFPHNKSEFDMALKRMDDEGLDNSETANYIRNLLHSRHTQEYGFTSVAIIAESHISLHTFPKRGHFTFDCYSCKDFDYELVKEIVNEAYGDMIMNFQMIKRDIPTVE